MTATATRTAPTPSFDFTTPAFRSDPYPFYAQLRRDMPIMRLKQGRRGESFYVSRYDDVMVLLRDVERFASDKRTAGHKVSWLETRLSLGVTESMVMRDGVDHRRLRTLAHKAFTPGRVAALEQRIAQLTDSLLDAADARGNLEMISGLALPLPVAVISDMMGVHERYRPHFHRWMKGILELDGAGWLELLTNYPSMVKLNRFLRELIAERRNNKGDDLLSAMIEAEEAGERLSFDELVASTLIILLAGHETTVNLIGNGMLALLENPEQLGRLRAQPELLDAAVEEMLRYTSPVQLNAPRYACADTELCGVTIPKGAAVCPIIGAANHDEAQFEDPERFDIGRRPNRHVAFGFGPHFCLGAPLARLEAKIVFRGIVQRYSDIRLAVPRSELTWRRSQSVRGLTALPLQVRR
ncbi:MAG TPA: cytochrome P450 [Nannocystis sp.]|jgi:cytochrome P450 PksS